ncbi:MAG: 2,3-bisphosphoglycerate-independent phosphoglycerate mutase [Candidatus Aminicenantes bacterium]|nr:2,3-bisphosphoglycerate-independent phosphoglycerate mutase [Candidatus Aminicenantes bacterium]NIM77996.1 2,3-bisphosphoglycerate-independent phosphoglycerate mutase [Candidatus Aminicenantes bacterium]NIN17318.1 2,3-bisphosphoglycerate-independent phosphoglycerate mutase [Candidatus Aminicenantes bacterium]NIN41210.1 2,3-bisphosphoglycerate-independent phosphoglycerate mutase [Candidatus Aminicenantes bacterium]NIN83984.1 2,3-bisphosphoglycerate-independent phosphoglycerate mutase [Candida
MKKSNLKLDRLAGFKRRPAPVLFVIMDGFGLREETSGNCVYLAKTPNIVFLTEWTQERNLYTQLKAHGKAVGMPTDKDMGNSEVGHNALGAGRIFSQGARLVNEAIEDGSIFKTDLWEKLTNLEENNTIHFIGLLSDGNVHSHIYNHLFKLLDELARIRVKKVRIHTLLDGRDVPSWTAAKYINDLEKKLKELNQQFNVDFRIASGGGRMRVTMDRYESCWKIVKRGWNAHVHGKPQKLWFRGYKGRFTTAIEAVKAVEKVVKKEAAKLKKERNEQHAPSFVIVDEKNEPVGKILEGDRVIFFNFRGDRAIQISKAFEEPVFNKFKRGNYKAGSVEYAGMLQYDGDLKIPKQFLVPPPQIDKTISQYLCAEGITQFACAETHKYGHVTYFWNGNNSGYIDETLETYVEIKSEPSNIIVSHPEMKADEVCDRVIKALESRKHQFIRVNFANPDMVGHEGNLEAGIRAVEIVDKSVGRLKDVITKLDGIMIVTSDHGNIEELVGDRRTSHTLNPVPFFIWDPQYNNEYVINDEVKVPQLANVAATLMNFLGFEKPEDYFESLVKFK